jgi:agmatinase
MKTEFQAPWNFLGVPEDPAARAWVLPIPYEVSTSYGAGTRNGPAAIIAASRQVELYDREFGCEPVGKFGVRTLPPLGIVLDSPEAMMSAIEAAVAGILYGKPKPEVLAILGGEHSLSGGVARALRQKNLVAVQIDAHADLREEYEGSRHSHACAARRIVESCPVFQIGIRNISGEEEKFRRGSDRVVTVFAEDENYLQKLARFVRGKTVYLTVDLDGLDPSIMPAVGTPEPGGLSWAETLAVVRVICQESARVPVFDLVELAPIPGLHAPDFLAAKLAYKIMSWELLGTRRRKT